MLQCVEGGYGLRGGDFIYSELLTMSILLQKLQQCVAVCCIVLQCVAVRCSALQFVTASWGKISFVASF